MYLRIENRGGGGGGGGGGGIDSFRVAEYWYLARGNPTMRQLSTDTGERKTDLEGYNSVVRSLVRHCPPMI